MSSRSKPFDDKYFIGIEVAHSRKGIIIPRRKYVLSLLKETVKTSYKPVSTPIDWNLKVEIVEEYLVVGSEMYYQCLIGRLIHLSHTRPNIALILSVIRHFTHSPKKVHLEHLQATKRILRYLQWNSKERSPIQKEWRSCYKAYKNTNYAISTLWTLHLS